MFDQPRQDLEQNSPDDALRQAAERAKWLARFPDENPNPVARVSADGTILYCNLTSTTLSGWECVVGQRIAEPLLRLVDKAIAQGKEVREDVQLAGRYYSVSVIAIPEEDYANLYGSDITERKHAELALRKLSRAVEHSPASVVITDLNGTIEYVNRKFTQLTGYTYEEALGQNPRILKSGLTPPEVYDDLWSTLKSGNEWQGEFINRKKNGDLYIESVSINPITNDRGEITHFVAIKEDITARRRTEEALAETAKKLKRSNRDLEQFAFVASHDLQEPLRKIKKFGDQLLARVNRSSTDEVRDYAERMKKAAERMQTMIDGLLELSRVSTRGGDFARVELTRLAQEALSDLEHRVQSAGGQVVISDLPTIEADELQIRQLFQNLIGNAIKYHKPGVPPVVRISCLAMRSGYGNAVAIQIADNGIGFEQQYTERIFLPFTRLHGRNEYEGTGLGLAICQKIVERHHGTIEVQSTPEVGTTFTITLPVRHNL